MDAVCNAILISIVNKGKGRLARSSLAGVFARQYPGKNLVSLIKAAYYIAVFSFHNATVGCNSVFLLDSASRVSATRSNLHLRHLPAEILDLSRYML